MQYSLRGQTMTDKIKVIITDDQKVVKIPTGIRMLVRRCCHAVLQLEGYKGSAEIGVTLIDDDGIKKVNKLYFGKDMGASVLTLPTDGVDVGTNVRYLGNVVISIEKAVQNSSVHGHSLQREVAYLTAHGMLELFGYSYEKNGRVEMREKEEWTLYQLGLPASSSYIAHKM